VFCTSNMTNLTETDLLVPLYYALQTSEEGRLEGHRNVAAASSSSGETRRGAMEFPGLLVPGTGGKRENVPRSRRPEE
jgi:hypothetical protein